MLEEYTVSTDTIDFICWLLFLLGLCSIFLMECVSVSVYLMDFTENAIKNTFRHRHFQSLDISCC